MQKRDAHFHSFLAVLYVCGVLILATQPLLTTVQPGYQGVLYKGGDESQYIMRVNQALFHPWTDVGNPYVSGPEAPNGLQMTLFEMLAGSMFSRLGMTAPVLAILLSVLIAPFVIPLIALIAVRLGSTRILAFLGAVLYFFLLLGPLRRTVHQSWSLPFVLFMLLMLIDWWRSPTRCRSLLLGVLLGILPGIYFWAWSFVWAVFGFLVFFTVVLEWRNGRLRACASYCARFVAIGCIALVTASPFLFRMWLNSTHPAADDAALQSSLVHAREFESILRSALLLLFVAASTWSIFLQKDRRKYLPLLSILFALVAVTHQQFVHGLVLSFWTHDYPYVCAAAVLTIMVFFSVRPRSMREHTAMLLASVFLFGAFVDYKGRLAVFTPIPHHEAYQHLAEPLAELAAMPRRQTVLSDLEVELIIGTYTDHDVIYTSFIRHTLIDYRELSERYCLTQFITGGAADPVWLAQDVKELSAAGREEADRIFARDVRITTEACAWVFAYPKKALAQYGVTMVLWDERNHPEWKPDTSVFEKIRSGSGWSMWVYTT